MRILCYFWHRINTAVAKRPALARGDNDFRLLVARTLARLYRTGAIDAIFARSFGKAKASEILQALYAINALPE
jgi:polar amino acid transport system substrate-binding protein